MHTEAGGSQRVARRGRAHRLAVGALHRQGLQRSRMDGVSERLAGRSEEVRGGP